MAVSGSSVEEDHAIVIGIERYLDGSALAPLQGARSDAQRFYRWVTARDGGAVSRGNATLVAPPPGRPRDAVLRELKRAFVDLGRRGTGKGYIGRRLYIYLAGHGIAQNREEASLYAADGGPRTPHRHIPGWCYASWFMYAAYFREVVLFADCCRTEYRDLPVQSFPLDPVNSPSAGSAVWVRGFAVKYGQSALEIGAKKSSGIFTSALLDALRHAYRKGQITARSVEAYLHNHPKLAKVRGVQESSFVVGEGDVVFKERAPRRLPTTRVYLEVKGDAAPTVEGGPPDGTWQVRRTRRARRYIVDLPAGIYAAKLSGRTWRYFEVSGEGSKHVRQK